MEERLLLDGVHVRRAYPRVHQRVVLAAAILPGPAVTALTIVDHALARAQHALDLAVGLLLVVLRLDDELSIAPGHLQTSTRSIRWGSMSRRATLERGSRTMSMPLMIAVRSRSG